ncbi:hypothetical protein J6S88_07980 [bacterium]|nr:hypothetical protein [bacterium]
MLKKLFMVLVLFLFAGTCNANVIPDQIQEYIKNIFPDTYFRYDGTIILPNNTVYLPVIPAKFDIEIDKAEIKQTLPANKNLSALPDAVIFNNDFSLLKVIKDKNNNYTLLEQNTYPEEIKSGILPQNIFLPRRLVIPDSLNDIKGNLESFNEEKDDIKLPLNANSKYNGYFQHPSLKDCTFYMTSTLSKNIKVLSKTSKPYAYLQKNSTNKIALYDDRFILVTSYGNNTLSVISVFDDAVIKEIELKTIPDEIVIYGSTAYVTSSQGHCIYVIDLNRMVATQQIMINGMCEKLTIGDDGKKLFYYDKQAKTLWSIELDNDYLLKDVGTFPNVSKIAYYKGNIYVTSRTRNRVAIIDYIEMNLTGEYDTAEKPVDLFADKNNLYILSAGGDKIQIINTEENMFSKEVEFPATDGFPSRFYRINDKYLLITDTAKPVYYIFDTDKNEFCGQYSIDEPIANIQTGKKIRKIYE